MDFYDSLKGKMEQLMRVGDVCTSSRTGRADSTVIDGAMVRVANGESQASVARSLGIHVQSIRNRVRANNRATKLAAKS